MLGYQPYYVVNFDTLQCQNPEFGENYMPETKTFM